MALPPGIGLRRVQCGVEQRGQRVGECGRARRDDRRAACRGSAARCARDRSGWRARCATTAARAAAWTCLSARLIGLGSSNTSVPVEQEIRDAAERVDVGAAVDRRFAHRHFRRDVSRRARGSAFHRQLRREVVAGMNLARPKSRTLTKSWLKPTLQIIAFDGLRSRWTRPCRWASSSDSRDRHQNRQDTSCRLRAERRHQRLETDAVEQLHHVVEAPISRHAEIVEVDRVGRLQARDHVGFALEAFRRQVGLPRAASRGLHANQLDRGGTRQHLMAGFPHLAHAAFTDRRDQPIASELARGLVPRS